ncbi:MAG: HAMP domain-containing histidine kinase [Pseudanabaenales cyanobacterium]|nr:HAMP domain-containing histidine kinase [Pseudanabaenales cyanobacterium]
MSWTNLIGLLLGIALGAGGSWLRRRKAFPPEGVSASKEPDSQVLALQKQLHQTQLAYCRMAEMEQFKGGFLARTSHELRSPISQLLSLHQMILSDLCDDPAEEREFVAQANLAALKLLERLDQLIDVSKLDVGRAQPQIQPLNLASLFAQVHQLTHMQAANQGLFLEVLPPDPQVYIMADSKWLQQVLVSLVQSAISLTETGSIRLLVPPQSLSSEQVYIWLEDHRPAAAWCEPLDLLKEKPALAPSPLPDSPTALPGSPSVRSTDSTIANSLPVGLRLEEVQSILQAMQGRVDILSTPVFPSSDAPQPNTSDPNLSRIQCSIPNACDPTLG